MPSAGSFLLLRTLHLDAGCLIYAAYRLLYMYLAGPPQAVGSWPCGILLVKAMLFFILSGYGTPQHAYLLVLHPCNQARGAMLNVW